MLRSSSSACGPTPTRTTTNTTTACVRDIRDTCPLNLIPHAPDIPNTAPDTSRPRPGLSACPGPGPGLGPGPTTSCTPAPGMDRPAHDATNSPRHGVKSIPPSPAISGSTAPTLPPPRQQHHDLPPPQIQLSPVPAAAPPSSTPPVPPPATPMTASNTSSSSSNATTTKQRPPRPLSLGDGSHITNPSSLQRHYRHQRHQSSTEPRYSAPTSAPHLPAGSTCLSSADDLKPRPHSLDTGMPFTGDNRAAARTPEESSKSGTLGGWSPGQTPTKSTVNPRGSQTSTPRNNTSASSPKMATSPSPSRFAFLSSSFAAFTKSNTTNATAVPAAGDPNDELLNLDVQRALFPSTPTSPSSRDPFSPAAFKNLEMNALALLNNFQAAYRRQSAALHELRVERDVQSDESEENETRTRHLKLQLENMARKAAEREAEMRDLVQALEQERGRTGGGGSSRDGDGSGSRSGSENVRSGSRSRSDFTVAASEDLAVEEDQKSQLWRKSGSDDTDEEESVGAPSVFSRSRSPTLQIQAQVQSQTQTQTQSQGNGAECTTGGFLDVGGTVPSGSRTTSSRSSVRSIQTTSQQSQGTTQSLPQPQTPTQSQSAFQKLMKGITGEADANAASPSAPQTCANCRGQDQRAAWDTVYLLRDENKGLKARVSELETCVEGALDAVNGLRM